MLNAFDEIFLARKTELGVQAVIHVENMGGQSHGESTSAASCWFQRGR
jgi:hypothetical protein